jgi:hypothetical protein
MTYVGKVGELILSRTFCFRYNKVCLASKMLCLDNKLPEEAEKA